MPLTTWLPDPRPALVIAVTVGVAAGRAADHVAAGPAPGPGHRRDGGRRRGAAVSDDQFSARVLRREHDARRQHVPRPVRQTHS